MKIYQALTLLLCVSIFATNGCHRKPLPVKDEEKAFSEEYPAWRKPELAVTELSITPKRADAGELITVLATVSNIGGGDTERATLIFSLNGDEKKRVPIAPLLSGASAQKEYNWKARIPGPHKVRAHLDLEPDSIDWLFSNNAMDDTIYVSGERKPTPELIFETSHFSALQPISRKPFTIPIVIHNPSFAKISNIPITFYIDDDRISVDRIRSLGPGDRQDFRISWPLVTPGEHIVTAQMDLPEDFPDRLQRNIRSWRLVVPDRTMLYSKLQKDKWVPIGPRIINDYWHKGAVGRMNAIAIHPDPTYSGTIYAGGGWRDGWGNGLNSDSGLWKTESSGSTWQPIGDKLDSMVIGAIAIDPKHPEIVYAATGQAVREPRGAGIFKSIDGGQTWSMFASRSVAGGVSRMVIRYPRHNEVMIYAGTNRGVLRYKSIDPYAISSSTFEWDLIKTGQIRDLVVHPINHSKVFASIDDDGLYRTDRGETAVVESGPNSHDWEKIGDKSFPKISTKADQILHVDIHQNSPNFLIVGILKPSSGVRFALYWSKDSGENWEILKEYAANELDESLYNPYVHIHPATPAPFITVYFGGVLLYKWVGVPGTNEGQGKTFRIHGDGVDKKDLKFYPIAYGPLMQDRYISLGDQGVYLCKVAPAENEYNDPQKEFVKEGDPEKKYFKSRDECGHRNYNLCVTQFYDFDISKTNPNLIIGGTQDTGNILYEGSLDWRFLNRGDGNYTLIDPTNPKIMYDQKQTFDSTSRSVDGGKKWNDAHKGLPKGYGSKAYITHDPKSQGNLLAAGDQVYYTYNGGSSWTAVGPTNSNFAGPVTRVAIQYDERIGFAGNWVAGTETGQIWFRHKPHSYQNWDLIFERNSDPASVQSIAFSVADPDVFYAVFNGGNNSERIYRFEMHHSNPPAWIPTNITRNLPTNIEFYVIAGDPINPFVAYLGTNKGVWRWEHHSDSILKWRPYNDGLPLTTVVDLLPVTKTNSIIAATKGRGAWIIITGP